MSTNRMSCKHLLAVAAGAALLLALVANADARIVPQKGIAGAKIGMTLKQVRSKLGKPDRKRIRTSPIGGFDYVELKYGKTKVSFDGTLKSSKVLSVLTRDRSEQTKSGVGVGSTRREVKRGVAGVRCKREFGVNHCWVGRFKAGKTVTDFRLQSRGGKHAKVRQVGVGIVLD